MLDRFLLRQHPRKSRHLLFPELLAEHRQARSFQRGGDTAAIVDARRESFAKLVDPALESLVLVRHDDRQERAVILHQVDNAAVREIRDEQPGESGEHFAIVER
ncbi:MAG: hypothetical protein WDN28_32350 [Chthoniobacter sp.]